MNPFFLLSLVADLLKSDKPTVEEIKCARTVVENLIKYYDPIKNMEIRDNESLNIMATYGKSHLTPEAELARRELQ